MEVGWFYLERGNRRGPVDLSELLRVLLAASEPGKVKVWREGLPHWEDAGAVPEVSSKLPPSLPYVPVHDSTAQRVTFVEAETLARLYRKLVSLFGAQYVLSPFLVFVLSLGVETSSGVGTFMVLLALAGIIGIFVWLLVTSYKLMGRVGSKTPILWVVGMCVPLVNLLVLAQISSHAAAWCRRHGIKVGFFGPSKESLEQLRNAEARNFSLGPG